MTKFNNLRLGDLFIIPSSIAPGLIYAKMTFGPYERNNAMLLRHGTIVAISEDKEVIKLEF